MKARIGVNPKLGWNFCEDQFPWETSLVLFLLMYYFHPFLLILFSVLAKLWPSTHSLGYFTKKKPFTVQNFQNLQNQIIIFYNHPFYHGNPALVHWGFKITRTTPILSFKLFVQKHKTSNYLILKYFKNPKPNSY